MIGKLLGHTQAATTARYAHLVADPVKAAAEQVSAVIANSVLGAHDEKEGTFVGPIGTRRATAGRRAARLHGGHARAPAQLL
jgi:hypothetical protein